MPQTVTTKATGLHRLQVCTALQVKWKFRHPSSHPAALIFVMAILWWLSMQSLPLHFHSEAVRFLARKHSAKKDGHHWQWVIVKTVRFSEMTGWEQIPQQEINAVLLNSLTLNKQRDIRQTWGRRNSNGYNYFSFSKVSASAFSKNLRFWIPVNCILEQPKK